MKSNIEIVSAAKVLATKIVERVQPDGTKIPGVINREELTKALNEKQVEAEKAYKAYYDETNSDLRIALVNKAKNAADELAVVLLALQLFDAQAEESESAVDKVKRTIREFGLPTHEAVKSGSIGSFAADRKPSMFSRIAAIF